MPSTVKVRIKAARNLASLTPTTIATATHTSTPQGRTSSSPGGNPYSPRTPIARTPPPTTHVTVTLGGHSAVAEYDEDEDHTMLGGGDTGTGGGGHNRANSKFQWQNMLSSSLENTDEAPIGGGNNSSPSTPRTSRCYSARTRTARRSTNPTYNEECRFEVADDTLLQDEVRPCCVLVTIIYVSGFSSVSCTHDVIV